MNYFKKLYCTLILGIGMMSLLSGSVIVQGPTGTTTTCTQIGGGSSSTWVCY